jgi:hypothetical protein
MAYPFKPLNTEKLKETFKKIIERNCEFKDPDKCRNKKSGNKLVCPARILKTWGQRVRNH